jgi:hypothetical protein
LSVFFLLASASAKAQEFFFPNSYSQPTEMVNGINVGRSVEGADIFAPNTVAPATATGRRQIVHRIAH